MTWMPWLIMAAPKSTGYSCTMTAGASSGITGYGDGVFMPLMGSIDHEPIPGATLLFLASGSGISWIGFVGNLVSLLSGLTIWIDNVQYPVLSWSYEESDNITVSDSVDLPLFVDSQQYFIEIK